MAYTLPLKVFVIFLTFVLGTTCAAAAEPLAAKAPPRTIREITAVLDDYRPDPERRARITAQLAQQPPAGDDRYDISRFLVERARVAREVGAVAQAIVDYRKAIDLGGGEEPARTLSELAGVESIAGNLRNAVMTMEKAIAMTPLSMRGIQTANYAELAGFQMMLGDMAAAREALANAETMLAELASYRSWGYYQNIWTSNIESGRAEYAQAQGRYADAEAQLTRAGELIEKQIERNPELANRNMSNLPDVVYRSKRIGLLDRLAAVQLAQGKFLDAEITLRDAFKYSLQHFGRNAPQTALLVQSYSNFLNETGRYREAETMARAALDITQRIGTVPESISFAQARAQLAQALASQGRWQESLEAYRAMVAALSADPLLRSRNERGSGAWATALIRVGRAPEAVVMLDTLQAQSREWLGAKHYRSAELGGLLGMALTRSGNLERALVAFRENLPILLGNSTDDDQSPARTNNLKMILEGYIELLARIRGTPQEGQAGINAEAEAFQLADALRGQGTQQAVSASAARSTAGTPELAALIRREQDMKQEAGSLRKILVDLMGAPPDQRLPKVIADMRARIVAIGIERKATRQDVERRFTAYHDLINPKPATIAQARAALKPGEALVSILGTEDATYVWAFKREGPVAFVNAKLGREALAQMVQKLRKSLDPGDVDIASGLPDFDLDTAYRLYSELLLPAAPGWQGANSLLVAANGALSQLPLAVLPTAKMALKPSAKVAYDQFRDVPWLVRQAAITELPSVNTLVTLRKLATANTQRSTFVGFGDPQFSLAMEPVTAKTRKLRNLTVERVSQQTTSEAKPDDWIDYGRIPPLPDTRDEILAIAAALKADPQRDVFLGIQASKANLQKLDLTIRKIIAFATHGLLPGDFPGVSEPSLALSNPGDGHHGLLTLEEILGLKLDADWVVLSACNTAAGDGAGADAISGLGRGFFYAGTRALLATHWPVESASARLLVTGIFERQQANPALSRAEALQQSMLALMGQKSDSFAYAHPLFWAPYALIGDGGGM